MKYFIILSILFSLTCTNGIVYSPEGYSITSKKDCQVPKKYKNKDEIKKWFKNNCSVEEPEPPEPPEPPTESPSEPEIIMHPTGDELNAQNSIMEIFGDLGIHSYSYPKKWDYYKETHHPIYWYFEERVYVQMPILNITSTERPDAFGIYRFRVLNSLSDLEEVNYYQPEGFETSTSFEIPVFEAGYSYIIITRCASHDMWGTILLPEG